MGEMDLVRSIVELLQYMGAVAIRINSGGVPAENKNGDRHYIRLAPAGTADILCCFRGRFVAIECKVGKNKPTPAQVEFLARVQDAGGAAIVAYSVDDVNNLLTSLL